MYAIGISDTVTTCQCCGKSGLKRTIVMRTNDGELVFYGSTCASRNSGKDAITIRNEINMEQARALRRSDFLARVNSQAQSTPRAAALAFNARNNGRWFAQAGDIMFKKDGMYYAGLSDHRKTLESEGWSVHVIC